MTFFAVLGFIWYLMFCFALGEFIGELHDAWRGVRRVTRPSDAAINELRVIADWLAIVEAKKFKKATP